MTETKENCRKQTGNLKLNNKLYPIYEGLNIIGRDIKATVILKETVFSKLHAAISVVDSTTHLICDLNSSNGTHLGKTKLIPYKFYSIKDHEPIIFGDIVGVYFKGNTTESSSQNNCIMKDQTCENIHELPTQDPLSEAPTQNLNLEEAPTQSIHEAPTQYFEEAPTQNLHEAPTQTFPEISNKKTDLSINEAPTQVFDEAPTQNLNEAPTQNFNDAPTQNLNDAPTQNLNDAPTQNLNDAPTQIFPEPSSLKIKNIHEAPTQITSKSPNKKTNLSIHEAPTQIFPESPSLKTNNIHEAPTQIFPESPSLKTNNIHEAPTHITSKSPNIKTNLSIHEAPTQIFPESPSSKINNIHEAPTQIFPESLKIHEAPTQIFPEPPTPNTSNYNISDSDEDATQDLVLPPELIQTCQINSQDDVLSRSDVEDDIFANDSFRSSLNQSAANGEEEEAIEVDDSVLVQSQSRKHEEFKKPQLQLQLVNGNDEMSDDDIILSTQESEAIDRKYQEHQAKLLSDSVCEGEDSDATDVEDEDILLANLKKLEESTEVPEVPETPEMKDDEEIVENKTDVPEEESDEEEEIDLLAASNTSKSGSNTEDSFIKEVASKEDDEIPATQLILDVAQMPPPKIPETNKTNENIFEAATQILPQPHETSGNEVFEAATQILPSEPRKEASKNDEDNIFEVATQILPEITTNEDIFSAATQILPLETTKEASKKDEDHIFEAATQVLPSVSAKEAPEEDVFSAATQIAHHPEIEDAFLAPTQILLGDEEESMKKLEDSPRLSSESINESMRLHLSETESSMPFSHPPPPEEKEEQQNAETQLEVDFDLETQKLYIEEKTRRPDNPLSHMFAEQATEQFEDIEKDTAENKNEDTEEINTNNEKLTPIVSLVDIKKSKITLKDRQEASTSKIKKSYVKLERIKHEPTRRSNRNQQKIETKVEEEEDSESEPISIEKPETTKTPKRKTRFTPKEISTPKVPEKITKIEEKITKKEEIVVKEDKPSNTPGRRRTRRNSSAESEPKPEPVKKKETESLKEVAEVSEEKITKKEEKIKKDEIVEDKPTNTTGRRRTRRNSSAESEPKPEPVKKKETESLKEVAEVSGTSEDSDFTETLSSRHNTRGKRLDYKSISKGETEIKQTKRGRVTSKSFGKEKIEEIEIHKTKRTTRTNDVDSDDSVFTSKRSKRHTNKDIKQDTNKDNNKEKEEDSDGSSINVKIRRKVPRIPETQEEIRPKRNTRIKTITRRQSDVSIEDSDESILETYKKRPTEENEPKIQTRKRNNQISPERPERPERTKSTNDICLNTPNSKRRKYEPLSVNISTSQISNGSGDTDLFEHKVVFTMLNDTNLETIVRKLGGSVVDSINTCTVLVTNKISRSLKFLIAVALGKPIVHVQWILDSEKRKKFQDPWDYLLEDTESEAKFQMSLKESLNKSRHQKLLSGETILLAATKNAQVLKEIIETSGGKCITRAPPKNTKTIVVCYEDERSKYSRYLKQKQLVVVSAEAIFSGVLQQNLNWKQYILS